MPNQPASDNPNDDLRQLRLSHIHNGNWEKVIDLQPAEDQEAFVTDPQRSLLEAHYQNLESRAIYVGETLVGYATFGQLGHVFWVARILIDQAQQSAGYGTKALKLIIDEMRTRPQCTEIRAAIDKRNALAEYLFTKAGFSRLGSDRHEIILSLEVD